MQKKKTANSKNSYLGYLNKLLNEYDDDELFLWYGWSTKYV